MMLYEYYEQQLLTQGVTQGHTRAQTLQPFSHQFFYNSLASLCSVGGQHTAMEEINKNETTEIIAVKKTLGGKICGKVKSRFIWIVVIFMEVLLTQYTLLTYLTPFFPTVADGLGLTKNTFTSICFLLFVFLVVSFPIIVIFFNS